MGISIQAIEKGLAGLRKLTGKNYVGALKPAIKTVPKASQLRYAPELTNFSGKVSQKLLNKSEVLAKYAQENGLVAEEVSAKFAEAEKYLDEVSIERLLKLSNEGKIKLYSPVKKSKKAIFGDSFFDHDAAYTDITNKTPNGILNYLEKAENPNETASMLKQLLALQEQGKIQPETINQLLKMQNAEFGAECNEFVEALKKGLVTEEHLGTAMIMMENSVPLKILNPKNFKEISVENLRYASDILRSGKDSYSKDLLLRISSHLSQSKPINKVSSEISSNFLKNFDRVSESFAKSGKTMDELVKAGGIQLEYSRNLFKENVLSKISHLSENEQAQILSKFGLEKGVAGRLNGLPAYIENAKGLSQTERVVNEEIGKFLNENKIILPQGFEEFQAPIEEICRVFPEFKYVIGVKSTPAHTKPIAEHILMAFQENMKNPLYKTLNASDRKVLGISTLLHDINKIERVKIDPNHALTSSETAQAIVGRMKDLSVAEKDRIIDLVKNHHWLEGIQNGTEFNPKAVEDLALQFRAGNDFTLAKIFAESDLKAVNGEFFGQFGDKLNSPMVKAVEDKIFSIQSYGLPISTLDITLEKGIAQGAVQKTVGEGENAITNWVINAKSVGLDKGVALLHSSVNASGYERAMLGATHGGEGIFSTTLRGKGEFAGEFKFYDGDYALGFRNPNHANILSSKSFNTGTNRSYSYARGCILHKGSGVSSCIKTKYADLTGKPITDEQYVRCYRELQGLNPTEIHSNRTIQNVLGSEQNAKHFEEAIKYANNRYYKEQLVIADPEAGFLATKVPYEKMAPDMQKFAQRHNLLIVEC